MLRALVRKITRDSVDCSLVPFESLLRPRTQTHAGVCNTLEKSCQRSYAIAAEAQRNRKKQRERVVIVGSGWAAASLAKQVDTSKFAVTVRDL